MAGLDTFTINPQPAVVLQANIEPLDSLQPPFQPSGQQHSTFFDGEYNSWTSVVPVHVTEAAADKKFLLNFFVQAHGIFDGARTFGHDPEMIVGPNGG